MSAEQQTKYVAAKAFNTVNRRFKEGDPVTSADLVEDQLGVSGRIENGFIVADEPSPVASVIAAALPRELDD